MVDREKVIRGLEEFKADLKPFAGNKADWQKVDNAIKLLKAQEHEIERLKHYVPCEEAEVTGAGCLGYGKGPSDDEPIDACKNCRNYVSYGVE